jgi:TolA-binding protein
MRNKLTKAQQSIIEGLLQLYHDKITTGKITDEQLAAKFEPVIGRPINKNNIYNARRRLGILAPQNRTLPAKTNQPTKININEALQPLQQQIHTLQQQINETQDNNRQLTARIAQNEQTIAKLINDLYEDSPEQPDPTPAHDGWKTAATTAPDGWKTVASK